MVEEKGPEMPVISVNLKDLEKMIGKNLPRKIDELNDLLSFCKAEIEEMNGEEALIEIKDGNRIDLWSTEGLARALKGVIGKEIGLVKYDCEETSLKVFVDVRLKKIRPYIACGIVKGLKLSDELIKEFMQMQEKLDTIYGRKRKKTSIGFYDFDKIKFPIYYTISDGNDKFVPLNCDKAMNLFEILQRTEKGIEYGHILHGLKFYPILKDEQGKILSFPPIINSNDLGKITEKTKNILIEVTGTNMEAVLNTLNVIVANLIERGGKAFSLKVVYKNKEILTPSFNEMKIEIETEQVNKIIGLKLNQEEIAKLLERARYGIIRARKDVISIVVPFYRIDILHPVDVIEDVAIMYGYNKMKPEELRIYTTGSLSSSTNFIDLVRELMVGYGFQEILSFTLINKDTLFKKMNLKEERVFEISNPKSLNYSCLRNSILPGLIDFLSVNIQHEYPQRIFECGDVFLIDEKEENCTKQVKKLCAVICDSKASFSQAKSFVEALSRDIGLKFEIVEGKHDSFINGRFGKIIWNGKEIGLIGEIHPKVLENFNIENPISCFEIEISEGMMR
ncbi:MAG: phenylalanine--tRNA ligase subunit beta [Candidatus Parvarchaeota archaeon]|nr:phenylalanine--tRNA ligase subunit beta [Candidatus Jingweiarchaeum tengchongense]MCW1297726.1 phenylalanine--tRNA ligase subunit beta [Candidatus Jingweiarchaeum tengchongense]MCW1299736.1 phenylalanine--tRNA ligase subunit beta [Candidatus Jingweiarchaeum tengchongense]MCW1304293.1 phenylalanine--tRNA ligase subunit beta [Candidatus Jingweiarchaeum tengchongense]MCW1305320.1 phenylalanine--tRNA ligase subunit beta [Candidatus Jingweiarchaeum tengchongense]